MTRRATKRLETEKTIKPKFLEERIQNITPLVPLNPLQAEYIKYIQDKNLVIATGFAGSSKTYCPTVIACDMWRKGEIDQIFLTRPNVSNSKSLGYFSGSLIEKMTNWLMPVLSIMYQRLGRNVVELAIKSGDICFIPLETIKGMSFGPNTFVICDEAEDITIPEAKTLITRQGGGKMVLAGDIEQSALDEKSGLLYLKKIVENSPELEKFTGFVDFNRPSDIVRSPACKAWILAFKNSKL
jgi:phosphate starvation-inducible PhoH-like protein